MAHTFDDEVIINQQDPIGSVSSTPLTIVTNTNDDPNHPVFVIKNTNGDIAASIDQDGIAELQYANVAGDVFAGLAAPAAQSHLIGSLGGGVTSTANGVVGFTSSTSNGSGSPDTGLSRGATAGHVRVGNGTHGDASGTIEAANIGTASALASDTDGALAANSDSKVATQKATKTYADTKIASSALDTDGTLAANSDAKVPSQKAVKTYADALIAANDAMVFKGVIDCSANPNYPAADRGHTYKVSVAGKIGGASGANVEAGDLLLCLTDGTAAGTQAAVGAQWSIAQANIDGAVTGPASATSGNVATFNGTSGKVIQDSGKALPSGTIVGTSDTMTLTNKTLTSPAITTPTINSGMTFGTNSSTFVGPQVGSLTNQLFMQTGTAGLLINDQGNTANLLFLLNNGRLGLGMSPTKQLELSLDSAQKPTTNTWTITSDRRVKKDIRPYTKGLEAILSIQPVEYHFNGKGVMPDEAADAPFHVSVIAQDLLETLPELVSHSDGEIDGRATDVLGYVGHDVTFMLIGAVKELKAQNDLLRARLDALESK